MEWLDVPVISMRAKSADGATALRIGPALSVRGQMRRGAPPCALLHFKIIPSICQIDKNQGRAS